VVFYDSPSTRVFFRSVGTVLEDFWDFECFASGAARLVDVCPHFSVTTDFFGFGFFLF